MTELEDMTPQEALAHFGKKGMKWGVRNDKPTSSQVYAARYATSKSKRDVVSKKRAYRNAKRPETIAKRKALYEETKVAHLANPDRATALRITKGDVALHGVLALLSGGFSAPVSVVGLTGTAVARRGVQAKQAYNKR